MKKTILLEWDRVPGSEARRRAHLVMETQVSIKMALRAIHRQGPSVTSTSPDSAQGGRTDVVVEKRQADLGPGVLSTGASQSKAEGRRRRRGQSGESPLPAPATCWLGMHLACLLLTVMSRCPQVRVDTRHSKGISLLPGSNPLQVSWEKPESSHGLFFKTRKGATEDILCLHVQNQGPPHANGP